MDCPLAEGRCIVNCPACNGDELVGCVVCEGTGLVCDICGEATDADVCDECAGEAAARRPEDEQ